MLQILLKVLLVITLIIIAVLAIYLIFDFFKGNKRWEVFPSYCKCEGYPHKYFSTREEAIRHMSYGDILTDKDLKKSYQLVHNGMISYLYVLKEDEAPLQTVYTISSK